jgi:hypothetical protein
MPEWFAIEVSDGSFGSARAWAEAWRDPILASGYSEGLTDWELHELSWGVVLELELPDDLAWTRLLASAALRAALDAVPDPVRGLSIHRGRGGSAGVAGPRRPRPMAGAGAVALPEPIEPETPAYVPYVLSGV